MLSIVSGLLFLPIVVLGLRGLTPVAAATALAATVALCVGLLAAGRWTLRSHRPIGGAVTRFLGQAAILPQHLLALTGHGFEVLDTRGRWDRMFGGGRVQGWLEITDSVVRFTPLYSAARRGLTVSFPRNEIQAGDIVGDGNRAFVTLRVSGRELDVQTTQPDSLERGLRKA